MDEFHMKYWNYDMGDACIKFEWSNLYEFYDWLDGLKGMINGRFTLRLNGGYAKNPEKGSTTIIDYAGPIPGLRDSVGVHCRELESKVDDEDNRGIMELSELFEEEEDGK